MADHSIIKTYFIIINHIILILLQIFYIILFVYNVQITYISCKNTIYSNHCVIYDSLTIILLIFGICMGYFNYKEINLYYKRIRNNDYAI
ncbi:hypothetical protein CHBEV_241 [Choristoneura biennis entomopoxvirus]|uniref:Uncharacterized protein n=1 Tax=Choristoneura biennis entomopoxvirus TaxID=10288 RepID=A0A916KPR1_CBEPV|nr:hypothetical protein CHBEV_241 [Choristoneura biennis entomopoxvirus]CCU55809.1 hypothetical protein CHBEV_241 [Choristoneura biennis entomopoxvirus]